MATPHPQFPESNFKLLAPPGDTECGDLLAWKGRDAGGRPVFISRWKLSWRERIHALLRGDAYIWVHAERTAPPISLSLDGSPFQAPR